MTTLRCSAALAIAVGLFLAYKVALGLTYTFHSPVGDEATYVNEHFALATVFVLASFGGGVLAFWLRWRSLLAASWGIMLGLDAPHLIRSPVPAEFARRIAAGGGGTTLAVGADPAQYVVVCVAIVGLGLCVVSEFLDTSTRSR
ncbi:MAG: hypothetical protein ABSD74_00965 [Rhizomicrobium sp.]|jgi:hypothetical protein